MAQSKKERPGKQRSLHSRFKYLRIDPRLYIYIYIYGIKLHNS